MAESFDALHEWLGIAPKDQPPNQYRLLGIGLYEDKSKVIDGAADRQMAHLRTFQTGSRSELCQGLLNKVSSARLLLLDPEKKADYDARLKNELDDSKSVPDTLRPAKPQPRQNQTVPFSRPVAPVPPSPKRVVTTPGNVTAPSNTSPAPVFQITQRSRRRKKNTPWVALAGIVVVIVGVLAVIEFNATNGEDEETAGVEPAGRSSRSSTSGVAKKSGATAPSRPPRRNSDAPSTADSPVDGKTAGTTTTRPDAPPTGDPARDDLPIGDEDSVDDAEEDVADEIGPSSDNPSQDDSQLTKTKPPIPPTAALEEAEVEIRDLFDIDSASRVKAKLKLADDMLTVALETDDNPAAQYAMLRMVRDMSTSIGFFASAERAISEMDQRFEIDVIAMRCDALVASLLSKVSAQPRIQVVKEGLSLVKDCHEADRFLDAAAVLTAVLRTVSRLRNVPLGADARRLRSQGLALAKQYEEIRYALETLKTTPDDPTANTSVGKYLCFAKGDWERGLEMLAKGDDLLLKDLAEREQRGVDEVDAQLAIADAWWKIAQKQASAEVRDHAAEWYAQVLPGLSGLERVRVQRRLDGLAKGVAVNRSGKRDKSPSSGETPATLTRAEKLVVGVYRAIAMNKRDKTTKTSIFELKPDRTVREDDDNQIGSWRLGGLLLTIQFDDEQIGSVGLRRKTGKRRLMGSSTDSDGQTWTWQAEPVVLVAEWEVIVQETKKKRLFKLFSNGRVGSPYASTTWTLKGKSLHLAFKTDPAWWRISSNGRTLSGRWLGGAHVSGRLVGP